jgi:hypothetical protein
MRELQLVPERSMHFCRCGHAEIAALFPIMPPHFLNPEAARAPSSLENGPVSPVGSVSPKRF